MSSDPNALLSSSFVQNANPATLSQMELIQFLQEQLKEKTEQIGLLEQKLNEKTIENEELKEKIIQISIDSDPSIVNIKSFNQFSESLSQKRQNINDRMVPLFTELLNLKNLLLSCVDGDQESESPKIHHFVAKWAFSKFQDKLKDFLLKNKLLVADQALKTFQNSKTPDLFCSEFVSAFSNNFKVSGPNLFNITEEICKILKEFFLLSIEMRGVSMSFVFPLQGEEFAPELHAARNQKSFGEKTPKILHTMKPGLMIGNVQDWKNKIFRKADVILSESEDSC